MRVGFPLIDGLRIRAGSRDRVVPPTNAEFLAQRLRNCQLAMLGAGHLVWEEAPDTFAQLLGGWIEQNNQHNGGS